MKRFVTCILAVFCTAFVLAGETKTLVTPTKLGAIDFDTLMYNANDIDILLQGAGGDCPCPKYEPYIHWYTNMCSIALGKETRVSPYRNRTDKGGPEDQYSVVIGASAWSEGYGHTVIGHRAYADDNRGSAYGLCSRSSGLSSVAVGDRATAESNTWGSVAIGYNAYAASDLGTGTNKFWQKPVAIGLESKAWGGTAVGHHSFVSNGLYTVALGGDARAMNNAIQIGHGRNYETNTAKIGNAYFVDVAGITDRHMRELEEATDYSTFHSAVLSYIRDLRTKYVLPEPTYTVDQPPDDIHALGLTERSAPVAADFNGGDLLKVLFGIIVAILGFFGIKKKTSTPDPEPTEEKMEDKPEVEAKSTKNTKTTKKVKKTKKQTKTEKPVETKKTTTKKPAASTKKTKKTKKR